MASPSFKRLSVAAGASKDGAGAKEGEGEAEFDFDAAENQAHLGMMALKMKVSQLERKNRALRHRSMIHRVMQVQVQDNLLSLRTSNEDLTRQLHAAEAALVRGQEGEAILRERLAEAEYRLDELMHSGPGAESGMNASGEQPPRRAGSRTSFSFASSRRRVSFAGGKRDEEEGTASA